MKRFKPSWAMAGVAALLVVTSIGTQRASAGQVYTIGQWELTNDNAHEAKFFKLALGNVKWETQTENGPGTIVKSRLKGDPLIPRNIYDPIGTNGALVQWTATGGSPVAAGKTVKVEIWIRGNVKPNVLTTGGWADDSGTLAKKPKIPTFEVKKVDPLYAISNSLDEEMGICNLEFVVNAPEFPFDPVTDPPGFEPFDSLLPNFVLLPGEAMEFDVPGTIDAGNFFYATGQIYEGSPSNIVGRFTHGILVAPEPATGALLVVGLGLAGMPRGRSWRV